MTEKFTAFLPVPPTANNLFPTSKTGRRFPSPAYKAWQQEAVDFLAKFSAGKVRPDARFAVQYSYAFADARRRDLANFEKAVTDLLVSQGVIGDDCQIDEMRLVRLPRAKEPRVFIRVVEIDDVQ